MNFGGYRQTRQMKKELEWIQVVEEAESDNQLGDQLMWTGKLMSMCDWPQSNYTSH